MKNDSILARTALDIDLHSLPQCRFSDKALPPTAAVYFVLHGRTLLYVGQTSNLFQRWHQGSKHGFWYYDGRLRNVTIAYYAEQSPYKRWALEYLITLIHRPRFNKIIRFSQNGYITQRWQRAIDSVSAAAKDAEGLPEV